ncbi:MAG TPA: hypothetical protein VI278_05610 [Nitrososphaeraceae archaeon]
MAAIVPIIVKNFLSIIATAHTIAVGGSFVGNIAFDPSNNDMYVAIPGGISAIDGSTNTVIKTIPFGTDHPFMIAYNPANKEMYGIASNGVTIAHDGVISVIDSSTSTVIKDITRTDPTTGKQFFDIVYNPNDNNMYATCTLSGAGFISIIDSTTDTIVGDMQLPPGPIAGTMAYDLANGDIYVTDTADAVDVIPIAASCNSGAVATAAPSITNANTTTATTCKPTADAGQPQTVTEGDKVTLQGSGTGDGTPIFLDTNCMTSCNPDRR